MSTAVRVSRYQSRATRSRDDCSWLRAGDQHYRMLSAIDEHLRSEIVSSGTPRDVHVPAIPSTRVGRGGERLLRGLQMRAAQRSLSAHRCDGRSNRIVGTSSGEKIGRAMDGWEMHVVRLRVLGRGERSERSRRGKAKVHHDRMFASRGSSRRVRFRRRRDCSEGRMLSRVREIRLQTPR